MWIECDEVMLPTNKQSKLCIYKGKELIWLGNGAISKTSDYGYNNQHIYITSNDEIKYNDWFMDLDKLEFFKAGENVDLHLVNVLKPNYKKIIASTDKSIGLHNISIDWIKYTYIEKYNEKIHINKVMIEYEVNTYLNRIDGTLEIVDKSFDSENSLYKTIDICQLKIDSDNTINIKEVKNSWNKEELLEEFLKCNHDLKIMKASEIREWVDLNL